MQNLLNSDLLIMKLSMLHSLWRSYKHFCDEMEIKKWFYTLNIDFVPEDKILIENLERDFSILHEQYKKRSKENFDLYYGIHHK